MSKRIEAMEHQILAALDNWRADCDGEPGMRSYHIQRAIRIKSWQVMKCSGFYRALYKLQREGRAVCYLEEMADGTKTSWWRLP